jgi:hypothetical protein
MHVAYSEVSFTHLPSQPFYLVSLVAKDNCLGHSQCIIKVAKGFKFVILFFDCYEELLDTVKRQFISLNQNLQGVVHEFTCHV